MQFHLEEDRLNFLPRISANQRPEATLQILMKLERGQLVIGSGRWRTIGEESRNILLAIVRYRNGSIWWFQGARCVLFYSLFSNPARSVIALSAPPCANSRSKSSFNGVVGQPIPALRDPGLCTKRLFFDGSLTIVAKISPSSPADRNREKYSGDEMKNRKGDRGVLISSLNCDRVRFFVKFYSCFCFQETR